MLNFCYEYFFTQLYKKPKIIYLLVNLTQLRKKPLKSRKTKPFFAVNWKIREIFSEVALASLCDEIDRKYLAIEKTKINF